MAACQCLWLCVYVHVFGPTGGGQAKFTGESEMPDFHTQQMHAPVTRGDRWGTLIGDARRHGAEWLRMRGEEKLHQQGI